MVAALTNSEEEEGRHDMAFTKNYQPETSTTVYEHFNVQAPVVT